MPTEDQTGFYIELRVTPDNGRVYVSSEQVPGLHLLGSCVQAMRPLIEKAIKRLFRDNHGTDVNLIWLSSAEHFPVVKDVLEKVVVYPTRKAA